MIFSKIIFDLKIKNLKGCHRITMSISEKLTNMLFNILFMEIM